MNKRYIGLFVFVLTVALLFVLGSLVMAQSDSQPDLTAADSNVALVAPNGDDSNPSGPAEVAIPTQYRPQSDTAAEATAASNGTATVYFTPQDENTSTTILFLYNTGNVAANVSLKAYRLDGSEYISTAILVPAGGLVRIAGDDVETTSASWQDVVVVNFTTFSAYAKMELPAGVKAEGYVVWNGGNTYDPLQSVPTLPLRFSGDPLTVFIPSLTNE